jgi:nucleoid-associated protein YgaU
VNSAHIHRRPRKIRRTGRHTTPSQVQRVTETAGKAAPALAIVGVLAAAPQAHAAAVPARAATVVEQVHTDAVISRDQPASRHYTVQPGDTLSSIAQRFYGNPADWLTPCPGSCQHRIQLRKTHCHRRSQAGRGP